MSTKFREELLGVSFHRFMNILEAFDHYRGFTLNPQVFFVINQLSFTDTYERLLGPFREPINGTIVHQRGKHSQTGRKGVP